ncbi:SubName: Full=Related to 20beta-hydroxysteroid dehydrogenase {ECO:0000313/EMBL:CCA70831.1} [Serendipita indica DSM 11827]|uniref:Related to 20beta-hydroxysteroid dehydrogenase n=1 Tax=Serendipita indica (strain DSM 11827) TaxID=1109443 RepID=G4THN8_SERID|nr:SubName: Full=Related to 20beta-hydroxysteroid dehydrogenase {ECO:0000313/EMBL:CCA70831.1} [Serendipita indica DSM 11827]CCA70831.1 related to 20beta-hydroxysteroid dehydrogenase [Serendipita indica DSM 11827]
MAQRSAPGSRQLSPLRSHSNGRNPQLDPAITPAEDPAEHPALNPGCVAVITGGASGIGLATAEILAELGLRIVLADNDQAALDKATAQVAAVANDSSHVIGIHADVSKMEDVVRLRERAFDAFGEVSVLLNNAGIGLKGTSFGDLDNWKKVMDVNLWGVINVQHVFVKAMVLQENPSVIITTGSKQGITNPPGNPAYNASKAAVKSITEGLAHELYSTHANVTAHLFVPGWTYTAMTKGDSDEKPAGAWSAHQTAQYMLDRVRLGDFYIICPDNETKPQLDRLRIRWAADDILENRPALSRWHPEWKSRFDDYIREGMQDEQRRRKSPFRKIIITDGDAGAD